MEAFASMSRRQFILGLSNGVMTLTVAGLFWSRSRLVPECHCNLAKMVLVVGRYLIEFVPQSPNACLAVNEFALMSHGIVQARVVNHAITRGFKNTLR